MRQVKKRTIASWVGFDFAQASYSIVIVTFVFPLYFGEVIVQNGRGDLYWGLMISVSMLLVALISPSLGAIADHTGRRKSFLLGFAALCIISTLSMYFLQPGMVAVAIILFVLANAGFEGGTVFYDSFLPSITSKENCGKVSGIGFAASYLGCIVTLLLTSVLVGGTHPMIRESFLLSGGMFLLFALPFVFFVGEKSTKSEKSLLALVKYGMHENLRTISKLREHRQLARFLLAYFVYNDAILTVIGFAGRYAKNSLHFTTTELATFFLLVLTVAVIGSLVFGFLTDRLGAKLIIKFTLILWIGVVIGAYLSSTATTFMVVGGFAGLVLGSSQSASRTLMSSLTPKEHAAEFFGFYDGFCGKASAVIGPIIYGVLSSFYGQRLAMLSMTVLFIIGVLLVRSLDPKKRVEATYADSLPEGVMA
jgi:UMF1 family MFS transporter